MEELDDLVGAVLGTRDSALATGGARAHGRGEGFDPRRIELFEKLQTHLIQLPPPERPGQAGSRPALSFIEAYFSNWIEGTEFELAEAEGIVFEGAVPESRSDDAHDIPVTAAGQQRIVVPLSFRDDYLAAPRALSRGSDPRPLSRVLDFAQEYAAAIDWSDLDRAEQAPRETNAFVPPDVAADQGLRLKLPAAAGPQSAAHPTSLQ